VRPIEAAGFWRAHEVSFSGASTSVVLSTLSPCRAAKGACSVIQHIHPVLAAIVLSSEVNQIFYTQHTTSSHTTCNPFDTHHCHDHYITFAPTRPAFEHTLPS
jgi:hypothetical protein